MNIYLFDKNNKTPAVSLPTALLTALLTALPTAFPSAFPSVFPSADAAVETALPTAHPETAALLSAMAELLELRDPPGTTFRVHLRFLLAGEVHCNS